MKQGIMLEFPLEEYRARFDRLAGKLKEEKLDGIVLTQPENLRYMCGYQVVTWGSKIGLPGCLVVTADGSYRMVGPCNHSGALINTTCFDFDDIRFFHRSGENRFYPQVGPVPTNLFDAMGGVMGELGLKGKRIGLELGAGFRVRMSQTQYDMLGSALAAGEQVDAAPLLRHLRMVKSPREIDALRKACQINAVCFQRAFAYITPGVTTEQDVYRFMGALAYELGAEDILSMGVNSHNLEYSFGDCIASPYQAVLEKDQMPLMIDGGPCYAGYWSDMIRQGMRGKPTERQQALYNMAVEANDYGLSLIKPGVPVAEICKKVDAFIDQSGFADANYTRGYIGHSIGLDVHENPSLEPAAEEVLEPGMAFAMEPLLHEVGAGHFGIEENFVVTETGYELLVEMPKTLYLY